MRRVNAQVSYIVDRGEQVHTAEAAKAIAAAAPQLPASALEADEDVLDGEAEAEVDEEATRTSRPRRTAIRNPTGSHASRTAERSAARRQRTHDGERDGGRSRRRRRGRGRGGEARGTAREARSLSHATPRPNNSSTRTEDHGEASPEEGEAVSNSRASRRRARRRRRCPPPAPARPPRRTPQPARPQRRSAVPGQWRRRPNPACSTRSRTWTVRRSRLRAGADPIRRRPTSGPRRRKPQLRLRPSKSRRAAARPFASRRHSATPARRRPCPGRSAADAGDLLDGERGKRPAQARLVGQEAARRQELAHDPMAPHDANPPGSSATRNRRSIAMARPASPPTWRCGFIRRNCSAATPSWCCMAAATVR